MKLLRNILTCTVGLLGISMTAQTIVNLSDYGVKPNAGDMSAKINVALEKIHKQYQSGNDSIILKLEAGRYDFKPRKSTLRSYFISNHDQDSAKHVAINLDGWQHMTFDGNGADIVCDGVMLPIALVNSSNCTLQNFSVDFANPHISQIEIVESDTNGITFRPSPEVKYNLVNHKFQSYGTDWTRNPNYGIAFDEATHRMVYNTSDLWCGVDSLIKLKNGLLKAPKWINEKIIPGTRIALRGWERPAPALFLSQNINSYINNVTVHYAEGMGLLAQLCENITMNGFRVAIRENSGRYFTTQADATHFSGCKGKIISTNGLYEAMMDDAINVHGTYLLVKEIISPNTLRATYMHDQSFGFDWGFPGDSVLIVKSSTMDYEADTLVIKKITKLNSKQFEVSFNKPLPVIDATKFKYGLENISWTPEVYFADNVIRNNRARGSLFSTPKKVLVERNLYDHTSGAAILLSGDCNGWFETGACHDVTIRNNEFRNALTSLFQFTEAVISIYPVIPDIENQRKYFHGGKPGIVIENNEFYTFDYPLLYAKSVDGLIFRNNKITHNTDFKPFHHNKFAIKLQRVRNTTIAGNHNDTGDLNIFIE